MGLIWTTLGTVPLILGARLTARFWLKTAPGTATFLAGSLIAWVWLSLGILALGHLGWIAQGPVVGWSCLALAIGGLGFLRNRTGSTVHPSPAESEPPLGWEVILAMGFCAWILLSLCSQSLIFPVKVVSDGPIYHLYFAAQWWKAGRIFLVATPFGENAAPYFPHVGELTLTWLFTLWGGDRLAKLAQVPFLLVGAVAAYSMARTLGAGRSAATLATILFATLTPYVLFTFEPNVDTIFVAGYLLAAAFFLRFALPGGTQTDLLLGALGAGACWGTKPTGIVFIPPILALMAVVVLVQKQLSWRSRLLQLGVVAFVPLVMEGYWLGRNLWLTGNPLYPLHVQLGNFVLLHGWYGPAAMPTSKYYLPVSLLGALVDTLMAVFDPRLAPHWIAAIVGAFLPVGPAENRAGRRLFAIGCVLNIALYWLLIPYRTQQRFLFHALGLGVVPLAFLLDRALFLRWIATGLLALHVLTPQGWPWVNLPWDLSDYVPNQSPAPVPPPLNFAALSGPKPTAAALSMLVGVLTFVAGWLWVRWLDRRNAGRLTIVVCLSGVLLAAQSYLIQPEPNAAVLLKFPPFRDYLVAWIQLDLRTQREPARIAYAGTNLPFYLMGSSFQNETRYVNIDAHRDWLLHDYHRVARSLGQPAPWPDTRPLWDRLRPDPSAWLANLRAERIRYLVVARANPDEGILNLADPEGFPIERTWAESRPDVFVPVYGVAENDPLIKIYALRSEPARK